MLAAADPDLANRLGVEAAASAETVHEHAWCGPTATSDVIVQFGKRAAEMGMTQGQVRLAATAEAVAAVVAGSRAGVMPAARSTRSRSSGPTSPR